MNYYIAKRVIQDFIDKNYINGKVNPKLRKEDFLKIIDEFLTARQREIVDAAWSTNKKQKRQNTPREAAEIADCSVASVYQNINRALSVLTRPKCKIVIYPDNQRVYKEIVHEGLRYKSISLAYISEERKTEEDIRLYNDGSYETVTIKDGKTMNKNKGIHSIPSDEFQSLARILFHELPLVSPHRYKGPEASLKVSLYDRYLRTADTVYFTKDNIRFYPEKYLDKIKNYLPIEHSFFTEADKVIEGIELESYMRYLFPKATEEQLDEQRKR